jgi:hypothetical protein
MARGGDETMIKLRVMDYHTLYNNHDGYYIVPIEGEQVSIDGEFYEVEDFYFDAHRLVYVLCYDGTREEVVPLVVADDPNR